MARKKAKKKIEVKKPEITEFGEFKLGDVVYAKLYTSDKIGYGKISSFHPKDAAGPAFTFYDEINSGFRSTLIENIVEKPSNKDVGRLRRARNKKIV